MSDRRPGDARRWTWDEAWNVVKLAAAEGLLPSMAQHNFFVHAPNAASKWRVNAEGYTNKLRAELMELFQGQLLVRITGPVWPGDHNRAGLNFYDRAAGEWLLPAKMAKVMYGRG